MMIIAFEGKVSEIEGLAFNNREILRSKERQMRRQTCSICGQIELGPGLGITKREDHQYNVLPAMCDRCASEEYSICDRCGLYFRKSEFDTEGLRFKMETEDYEAFMQENICPTCFWQDYTECDLCGTITQSVSHITDWANTTYAVCENCRSYDVYRCEYCGQFVLDSDIEWLESRYNRHSIALCPICFDMESENVSEYIRQYHDKPRLHFHKCHGEDNTSLYLGVELEIECFERTLQDVAESLYAMSDDERLFYMNEDGSLDYGLEIISQPCTLSFHQTDFPWLEILTMIKDWSATSDNSTCGLHVHVSEEPFTLKDKRKLAYFVHTQQEFFTRTSRRTWATLNRWAKFKDKDINESPYNCNRREAINFQNSDTVEFRVFNGTEDYVPLLASIELVHASACYVLNVPSQALLDHEGALESFLTYIEDNSDKYKNLKEYLAHWV